MQLIRSSLSPLLPKQEGGKKAQVVVYIPLAHAHVHVCTSLECSSVARTYLDLEVTDETCLLAGRHLI